MKEILYILSDVVHVLQKERGCTSMFLCSEGTLFNERMESQFLSSDKALQSLTEGLKCWEKSNLLKTEQFNKLKTISALCEGISKLRENVRTQQITVSQTIDHYAHQLISPLLQVMIEIALYTEGHNPVFVSAYNAFLQWKERIGLERSISVRGFVKHSFNNAEFMERILFLLSEQRNYRRTFLALANHSQKELIENLLKNEASIKLKKLHSSLRKSSESKEIYALTPEDWFDLITAKIDALYTIEKELINSLDGVEAEQTKQVVQLPNSSFGEYDNLINSLQLFSGLSSNHLESVLQHGQIREFYKGKLLFLEGEQANRLYIVLKGWVKIFKGTAAGNETTLQMLSSGDSVLESAIFLNTPFPVSAQIAEDAVLLSIPAPIIREQVKNNNELALNLLTSMSYRSQGLIRQIEDARLKSVDERIGWFLLRLLLEQDRISREVKLPYDKSLIASYLDMKRETFSRSLKRLKAKGFKIESDTIVIPELSSLCGFCDQSTAENCPQYDKPDCPNPTRNDSA